MSTFPNFSNIAGYIQYTLKERKNNPLGVSSLNAWIKVTSGTSTSEGNGLVMYSNPNMDLFKAAGDNKPATIYGSSSQSGALGVDWNGKPIIPLNGVGLRPTPIIESMEVDEGAGNLSRKASFSIKCFSLEQMELVTKYFLEPGFTIFLEWGQNHPDSMLGITKSNASEIADHQNFKTLSEKRKKTKGTYDNYLGYITGGSTEASGEVWTVNVKCTGFTELPAYLINGDNSGTSLTDEQKQKEKDRIEARGKANEYFIDYGPINGNQTQKRSRLNLKRWKMVYNELPSNRKTQNIKSLETKSCDGLKQIPMAHAVNYINFDENVVNTLNRKGNGSWAGRTFGGPFSTGTQQDGASASIPGGVDIVGNERFIRFGALMKIFNTIIAKSYEIGDLKVPLSINSSISICGAYPRIFSVSRDKLFIPNADTPKFDLVSASKTEKAISAIPKDKTDNSIIFDGQKIQFPNPNNIVDGVIKGVGSICYFEGGKNSDVPKNAGIQKAANYWGKLDDLYVNFDFAYGILETSNLNVMEALYQILNGMSSAVNDLWNFQIISYPAPEASVNNVPTDHSLHGVVQGTQILTIIDANFTYKDKLPEPYEFNLIGTDSIFKEANFNMEMSGAKMNQIIGSRLGTKISSQTQPVIGKLFSKGNTDLILNEINTRKPVEETKKPKKLEGKALEEAKARMYAQFLGNLGSYPRVKLQSGDIPDDFELNDYTYVATFNDSVLLGLAKSEKNLQSLSPILPITFSFTISGVSGIKRGDKFKVVGIPKMYYTTGFFQVIGVSHSISGMQWNTTVEGAYRRFTT
jgi:hypothetical protein